MRPRRLLVAWWSNTGGTERLVEAAADGARRAALEAGAEPDALDVLAVRCDRLAPAALLAADALLFAAPECLGSMAGPAKAFFDRCYYPVLEGLVGRPYATLVCAGTDGHGALRQIERIATGWRLRRVADPVIVLTGAQTPGAIAAPKRIDDADLGRAAELGATLGAGTALGIW
ncbi:MAG TPA: NAD(P)H-dependent oxidoreductase [Burkholderiaceae bacterium]|nr:NAD(P)H-dependent oxidoreductase [Burkholderiaceae bacterium]